MLCVPSSLLTLCQGSPARAKSVSPVKDIFFNDMQFAGLSLGAFSNNSFEIGALAGAKDDDEFSSIADDLKSLQDESNDNNGEVQSGRCVWGAG